MLGEHEVEVIEEEVEAEAAAEVEAGDVVAVNKGMHTWNVNSKKFAYIIHVASSSSTYFCATILKDILCIICRRVCGNIRTDLLSESTTELFPSLRLQSTGLAGRGKLFRWAAARPVP